MGIRRAESKMNYLWHQQERTSEPRSATMTFVGIIGRVGNVRTVVVDGCNDVKLDHLNGVLLLRFRNQV
jgi:hypothetical protein